MTYQKKDNYFRIMFLCLMLTTGIGSALSAQLKDSVQLDQVLVTGTKTVTSRKLVPLSVSQISRSEIESAGMHNILSTLNMFVPGVFVTERNILGFGVSAGSAGSISMRGLSSSPNTDVLVLIDGHPQYQGLFGHPLADAYVASDVEKVEIIHGPASILYGSNAVAGTINIITRKQNAEGLKGTWGASYGTFNTQKYYGTLGYKKDRFDLFLSVNHDQTAGTRDSTDFSISNAYGKAGYRLNDHLQLTADFSTAGFTGKDNGPVFKPKFLGLDITRGKTSLSLENHYAGIEGALKFYHNFGEHTLTDGFHSTDHNSGIMLYQTVNPFKGNQLTLGVDLKQYGGRANQIGRDSSIVQTEAAFYAYSQQSLFDKLAVSAGIRWENNSKFGDEWVPMVGVSYNPFGSTTIKASASKGYRSPTVMELYYNAPNPSPDLKPESVMNYELGWLQSLLAGKLNFEATIFKMKSDNMIQIGMVKGKLQRLNSGSFESKGVEFSARYAMNSMINLGANYSFSDLNKAVLASPRQQLNLNALCTSGKFRLMISGQYINQLYTDLKLSAENYFLLNSRLQYQPNSKTELFVMCNNVLNKGYEINAGYPMPGRNVTTGLNVRF